MLTIMDGPFDVYPIITICMIIMTQCSMLYMSLFTILVPAGLIVCALKRITVRRQDDIFITENLEICYAQFC